MGVNIQNLVFLGVKLDEEIDYDTREKHEVSYWDEPKELCTVTDGMSGDYCFIAFILAATYNDREYFGNNEQHFCLETLKNAPDKIIKYAKETFNIDVKKEDVKMYAVTHHS